ncbi:MAG: hypothetical protein IH600_04035 [Bacteroidetes bacterium]|nr:hypothetical protein [Bacteroidota bacterium]
MFRITTGCAALLCAAGLLLSPRMHAQEMAVPASTENDLTGNPFLEQLLNEQAEGEQSALLERFDEWLQNPLPLASARLADITALPFLTRAEARRVRAIARDSVSVRDPALACRLIDSVLAGDADRIALLHLCTRLREAPDVSRGYTVALRSRLQQEDEPRAGFLDGRYPGSRLRLQQRLRAQVGEAAGPQLDAAVLIEKDPGEIALTDHLAGYVSVRDVGPLRRAVLGDFAITAGQGLVFWQAFGLAKGGEAVRVGRAPDLLSPYSSATEGFGASGAAVQLGGDFLDAVVFYSRRGRDASIDSETGTAGAFSIDGLHRSESEQARRGSVDEQMAGGHVGTRLPAFGGMLGIGTSAQGTRYSVPSEPRTPFGFRGDEAWVLGADAAWNGDRLSLFGEAAWAHTHVPAFIAGMEAELTPRVSAALILRRYHERFVSLQGAAFGERDGVQNEEGAYIGLRLRPARGVKINAWMDIYRFPNRTYFVHLPSSGVEGMCAAEFTIARGTVLRLRAGHVRKDQTVAAVDDLGRDIRPITRRLQSSVRAELQHEAKNGTRARLRAEYAQTTWEAFLAPGDGMLLSADLRVKPHRTLSLLGRLTAYGTDSYDARLYQFEHDVRGVMQNVVMYGDGLRAYLLAQWEPLPRIVLGLRYALTVQDGVRSMSSGADEIAGDRIGKVSLQLDAEW